MKRIFVLMAALMIISVPSFAQKDKTLKKGTDKKEMVKPRKDKKERIERKGAPDTREMEANHEKSLKMKRNLFEKELRIEGDQFEKFWIMYETFDKEMFSIEMEMMNLRQDVFKKNPKAEQDLMVLSEEEATILFDKGMEMEHRKFEIQNKYLVEFREVLKTSGVLKLKELEDKFEKIQVAKDTKEREKHDRLFSQPAIKTNN